MAADTIIQIKRTTGTGVPAGGAERGELVYVYDTSDTTTTGSQGGNTKRLFIGDGSGQSLIRIGGEYYTNLLEVPQGTLTANKAIVTDNNKAIDDLYVGNNSTTGGSIKLNEGTNNGSHYVALKASDSLAANITFRLPESLPGSTGQALVSDTSGNLSFQTVGGTLDIAADTGTDNGVVLGTDTLTITGGTGISTSVTGDTITVNGDDATTTTKGVASFATSDFAVTNGGVSIKTGGVSITQLEENTVTIGSDSITLGDTLSAFTSLTVDNITVNGNTVTATTGNLEIDVTNGVIDVNNNIISGVATPVNTQDAANKQYVDDVAQGLHIHASVEVASTTNFAGFSAGTITLSSPIAVSTGIDGFTDAAHLVTGARILIKDQTNANENGIYTMNVSGSAGSEQIDSFTRADDFNTAVEIAGGDFVFVIHGTEYANTGWVQTEHVDTVNTDDISFTQFSGAGTFLAGDGLTLTGNEFSVVGTSNRISVSASGVDIDTNQAGQSSFTTPGTIATGTWNANVIGPVYGGTGLSSYTTGDLVYASTTNTLASLGIGSTGEILTIAAGVPTWTDTIDGGTY